MSVPFRFHVITRGQVKPIHDVPCAHLIIDNWNDWRRYQTMYTLVVVDSEGERMTLGSVKIGETKFSKDLTRPSIPDEFDELGPQFFSLGQDDDYYAQIARLDPKLRDQILNGLRDVVASNETWLEALKHDVTRVSLLRSVSQKTVVGQFRRILSNGAPLTEFGFRFEPPPPSESIWKSPSLDFEVQPESNPPTNVHALIGRNGVGKSRTLNSMASALVATQVNANLGRFVSLSQADSTEPPFSSVISVTFSAFDEFPILEPNEGASHPVKYVYIGLTRNKEESKVFDGPKTPKMLATEFATSVNLCISQRRGARWQRALKILEADPLFREATISSLAMGTQNSGLAQKLFARLSSGHKIVLLTITKLIECTEEKTFVLIDEPEAHLHPPLLAAFIRALSDLMINRNAVALIATHSPVVLQEIPQGCVWVLRRTGTETTAERPEIETFGENVGVLTREVFRLEVLQSGFHQLLKVAALEHQSFEEASASFGDALGSEARAILQALFATKSTGGDA